jgi:hypothetical protein
VGERPQTVLLKVADGGASLDLPRWRACSLAVLGVPSPSPTDNVTFSIQAWATGTYATRPLVRPKVRSGPTRSKVRPHP